jgi:hypothetical protein
MSAMPWLQSAETRRAGEKCLVHNGDTMGYPLKKARSGWQDSARKLNNHRALVFSKAGQDAIVNSCPKSKQTVLGINFPFSDTPSSGA